MEDLDAFSSSDVMFLWRVRWGVGNRGIFSSDARAAVFLEDCVSRFLLDE